MPQQAYCQPREYQGPPPAPQGSTMYPGPPPHWDAPYEPAGDVSCLWVLPSSRIVSWIPSNSFHLLTSPWGFCSVFHLLFFPGYFCFKFHFFIFSIPSSCFDHLHFYHHLVYMDDVTILLDHFYCFHHVLFLNKMDSNLNLPLTLHPFPDCGCVAVDLVSHRYYKHVHSLSQR